MQPGKGWLGELALLYGACSFALASLGWLQPFALASLGWLQVIEEFRPPSGWWED